MKYIVLLLLAGCTTQSLEMGQCRNLCGFKPVRSYYTEQQGQATKLECICMPEAPNSKADPTQRAKLNK